MGEEPAVLIPNSGAYTYGKSSTDFVQYFGPKIRNYAHICEGTFLKIIASTSIRQDLVEKVLFWLSLLPNTSPLLALNQKKSLDQLFYLEIFIFIAILLLRH